MKNMPNNAERAQMIKQMVGIVRQDAPWAWGFYPKDFVLSQSWVGVRKPADIVNNQLKYLRIDPSLRKVLRAQWNQPLWWPLLLLLALFLIACIPIYIGYRRKIYSAKGRRVG